MIVKIETYGGEKNITTFTNCEIHDNVVEVCPQTYVECDSTKPQGLFTRQINIIFKDKNKSMLYLHENEVSTTTNIFVMNDNGKTIEHYYMKCCKDKPIIDEDKNWNGKIIIK